MRWLVLFSSFLLVGCAGIEDLGVKFTTATSAFATSLDSDAALELDLIKDIRRKSEQLQFISLDSYTCGDPNDAYTKQASKLLQQSADKVKKQAITSLKKQLAQIDLIIGYGETISKISQGSKDFDASTKKMSDASSTLSGLVSGPEATAVNTAVQAVITIVQTLEKYEVQIAVYYAAKAMNEQLVKSAQELKAHKNLKVLTYEEAKAYSHWESCALERLRFIRDYFPPVYLPGLSKTILTDGRQHLRGIMQSGVLDFTTAYSAFISEREQFLARRPDYESLIDAIVKANKDILDNKGLNVALDTANQIGKDASTLNSASNKLRKSGV
jgi:hypothetical protein